MRIRHYENVSIETYIPGFHPGSQGVYSARRVSARKSSRQCSRRRIRAECWWPAWRRGRSSSLTASESPVSPQSLVLSTPRENRDLQVNHCDQEQWPSVTWSTICWSNSGSSSELPWINFILLSVLILHFLKLLLFKLTINFQRYVALVGVCS